MPGDQSSGEESVWRFEKKSQKKRRGGNFNGGNFEADGE